MKNFILGVIFIALISGTTVNLTTFKPQKPKNTIVKIVPNSEIENYIKNHIKAGYIVKNTSITADNSGGSCLVILELY